MLYSVKSYRFISYAVFALHILLFLYAIVCGFFPFMNGENFYTVYRGILIDRAEAIQPYLILALPALSSLCSFFALKRPLFQAGTMIGTFSFFFVILIKPITMLEMEGLSGVSPFDSPVIGTHIFEKAFYALSYSSYILFIDLAFAVFSLMLYFYLKSKSKRVS